MNFSKNLLIFTFLSFSLIAPLTIIASDRVERRELQIALVQELATVIKSKNNYEVLKVLDKGARIKPGHYAILKALRDANEADYSAQIKQAVSEDAFWLLEDLNENKLKVQRELNEIEQSLKAAERKQLEAGPTLSPRDIRALDRYLSSVSPA